MITRQRDGLPIYKQQAPMNLPEVNEIFGVEWKSLKTHPDDRGFFREIVRETDTFFTEGHFGQWSHSRMQQNVVKAWHYHHVQTDWWYVPIGAVETVLFDNRSESPTYRKKSVVHMGDSRFSENTFETCVRIPPGVLHACKVLSEEAHLFYITSHTYNANEEGRLPYNSTVVGHDWGHDVIVAENDKRTFTPTSTRVLVGPVGQTQGYQASTNNAITSQVRRGIFGD